MRAMRVIGYITLLASSAVTVVAAADEVTLSGASCFPIGSPPSKPFEAVVTAINDPFIPAEYMAYMPVYADAEDGEGGV